MSQKSANAYVNKHKFKFKGAEKYIKNMLLPLF